MASQTGKLIAKIQKQVDESVLNFNGAMPSIEKTIYSKLQLLLKQLEIKNGRLISSPQNIRLIARLKSDIEAIIRNPYYTKQVKDFAQNFDIVKRLQADYFGALVADFTIPAVIDAIKTDAVTATVTGLTESGVTANVTEPIQAMLRTSITTGGSYADLVDQVRSQIVSTKESEGILMRYVRQQTVDSINQYSATVNFTMAQSLNYNWFRFTGSLLTTSRPMCMHMVPVSYFHLREIPDLLNGIVRGEQTPMNKKTGLPLGFKDNTTESNYISLRNGWQCGHQIFMISEAMVPEDIRKMIYNKFGINQ